MKIKVKRVYGEQNPNDGIRILVDRLWPRGLSKEEAHIDLWLKSVAPSNDLRKWYQHDAEKWIEFKRRYFIELTNNPDAISDLLLNAKGKVVSLVHSLKENRFNNAVALKEYLNTSIK